MLFISALLWKKNAELQCSFPKESFKLHCYAIKKQIIIISKGNAWLVSSALTRPDANDSNDSLLETISKTM